MPEPNSVEDFLMRIEGLLHEARSYGIAGVAVLQEDDPIARKGSVKRLSASDPIRQIGLLQFGLWEVEGVLKRPPEP